MKIGMVFDDSLDRNDGVQQYIRTLGSWLRTQGHTVHYLVGESRGDGKTIHSLSKNVNVRFNGNRFSIPLPTRSKTIKNLLEAEKYDVLHVQMPYNPLMAGKIIKFTPAATAIVGTFHILPLARLQKFGNKALYVVQKRQLKQFNAICSVSAAAAEFAKSHYKLTSRVIPNMINLSVWKTKTPITPGRIVFLGRLVPRKGCMNLLAAFALLPADLHKNIELLVAGDGPERQKLEKFVASSKLANVKFLGYIDEKSKPDLLASAQVAVFPSLGGESFGIVLIEAMAAGTRVVLGGNNPGYASVLSGLPQSLIDPKNSRSFATQLKTVLTNVELQDQLHKQQQMLVKNYDVNIVGKQITQMYKQVKSNVGRAFNK